MRILIFDHLTVNEAYLAPYKILANVYGHEVLVVRPNHWLEYGQKIHLNNYSSKNLSIDSVKVFFPNKFNRLIYRFSLKRVKKFNPDIIYSNSEPENFSSFYICMLKKTFLPKINIILVSWRNIDFTIKNHPYSFGFIYNFIEKISLNNISAIIGFNEEAVRIFKKKNFNNIWYIPMGIDTSLFKIKIKPPCKFNSKFNIGFIGRFEKAKGVQLLLKAMSLFDERFECTLVGNGPCELWYRQLAEELGISDRVNILGGVLHTDIPEILYSFDVLVLPSLSTPKWIEQFGRVLVEAMISGVPVIGSSSGEIPYVIKDSGLIFKEGDINQLAECIFKIANDSEFKIELIEKGIKRASENYSWEIITVKWDELFKKVALKR